MTQTDTPTATPTATEAVVARYLTFWNTAPGREQVLLAPTVFRADVDHRGPLGSRTGMDELVRLSQDFAEHLGDLTFRARTQPQAHHDRVRLQWEVVRGEESFAEGTDVLALDEHGLVEAVVTFLDRAPEGFEPH